MSLLPMSKVVASGKPPAIKKAVTDLTVREGEVVDAIRCAGCPLTDREIALFCGYDDMNAVRPSITRLVQRGVLFEAAQTYDEHTNRTVRKTGISEGADVR